ncbi:hypothetical protein SEA_VASANTI_69 [Gordonia phage Vasanti]|uniref:Uncharacterized protein n=1 Tax=Gordonia phage Vasanti TaxID=2502431 RepID=A0A411BW22_9CAUD|nr:hypothetical protein PP493_gp69 [Gordonia phage Vasanti]QAY05807.1 hypothetical protein SEA_VASANTI_69 [Gordonia phage Vasanti]
MPEFIARTDSDSTSGRTGPGRWSVVMTPCPGVLWTNDTDAVGFVAIGQVADTIFESIDIDDQIQAGVDAGRTATQVFDGMAALVGKSISEGELTNWGRPTTRLKLDPPPQITKREILDQTAEPEQ